MERKDNLKEKINEYRELLYKELDSDVVDYKKLLELSEELDKIIVEYYQGDNIKQKK